MYFFTVGYRREKRKPIPRHFSINADVNFGLSPAPKFEQKVPVERPKLGVVGGQTEPVLRPVLEKWYIGGRIGPGFGEVPGAGKEVVLGGDPMCN